MKDLAAQAKLVLQHNWRKGFTIPCEGLYPFQWFWDSGFIALGWAHIDLKKSREEFKSLFKGQWKNGFIPHIIFHNPSDSYYPGPEVHQSSLNEHAPAIPTSGITQPPVLGFILEEILELHDYSSEALDLAREVYDNIFLNHKYFYTHRDPGNVGLVYICHNWEAGTDNTPVWDYIWETFEVPDYTLKRKDTQLIDADHRPTNKEYQYYIHLIELFKQWNYADDLIAKNSPFLVIDPLFNAVLIKSNESLINIGKRLGYDDQVAQLQLWQHKAKVHYDKLLFDAELGGYIYYDLRNHKALRHLSSSSFSALYAGIPDEKRMIQMKETLIQRFQGTDHANLLCASFDPTSALFNSKKYWRGPVWINLNWILYKGLLRYECHDLAETVKKDTLELLNTYGFYEYFEPSKALNENLTQGYGGKNFSWSAALYLDFIKNE